MREVSHAAVAQGASCRMVRSGRRVELAADTTVALATAPKVAARTSAYDVAAGNGDQAMGMLDMMDDGAANSADLLLRMRALTVQGSADLLAIDARTHPHDEARTLGAKVAVDNARPRTSRCSRAIGRRAGSVWTASTYAPPRRRRRASGPSTTLLTLNGAREVRHVGRAPRPRAEPRRRPAHAERRGDIAAAGCRPRRRGRVARHRQRDGRHVHPPATSSP